MATRNQYNYGLRDLARATGRDIQYNPQSRQVTIDNQNFDTTNWQNIDGRFMGTSDMAKGFINQYSQPNTNLYNPADVYMNNNNNKTGISGNVPTVVDANNTTGNVINSSVYDNSSKAIYDAQRSDRNNNTLSALTGNLNDAYSSYNQEYNPYDDEVFNQLAKFQQSKMLQDFASRGLGASDNALAKINQANLQLAGDFRDRELNRRQQNITNARNQLNDFMSINDATRQQYGVTLTPQAMQLTETIQGLAPQERQWLNSTVQQTGGDYAAAMQNLDPNTREYQILNAGRLQKILANPTQPKFADYLINDYGFAPNEVSSLVANQLSNSIEALKSQYAGDIAANELAMIQAELEAQNLDNAKQRIENANLPASLRNDLAYQAAQLEKINSDIAYNQARTNNELTGNNATTMENETAPITYSQARSRVDQFISDNEFIERDGNSLISSKMNTVPAIVATNNYIEGLPLAEDDKNSLLLTYFGPVEGGQNRTLDDIRNVLSYAELKQVLEGTTPNMARQELVNNRETYINAMGDYYYNFLLNQYQ